MLGKFLTHDIHKSAFPLGVSMKLSETASESDHLSVRELLKAATNDYHNQLNQHSLLLGLTQADYSLERYRTLLVAYYHLYQALEQCLIAFQPTLSGLLDYSLRIKLPWIFSDLAFFGIDAPASDKGIRLPPFTRVGEYIGVLYVIEGSMLGGQLISRNLLANLGLSHASGARFYWGYAEQTVPMWKDFLRFAETIAADEQECRAATQAACQTFQLFMKVLDDYACSQVL